MERGDVSQARRMTNLCPGNRVRYIHYGLSDLQTQTITKIGDGRPLRTPAWLGRTRGGRHGKLVTHRPLNKAADI